MGKQKETDGVMKMQTPLQNQEKQLATMKD